MSDADYLATIARTAIASGNAGYSAGLKVSESEAQRKLDRLISAVSAVRNTLDVIVRDIDFGSPFTGNRLQEEAIKLEIALDEAAP